MPGDRDKEKEKGQHGQIWAEGRGQEAKAEAGRGGDDGSREWWRQRHSCREVGWGTGAQTGPGTPELEVQRACGRHRPSPAARLRLDSQSCHLLAA